jgi:cytochrome P450
VVCISTTFIRDQQPAETYLIGDMIYLTALGQPILVVSSLRIASDLLEKRSSIYSGRMRMYFGREMVGWRRSLIMHEGHSHREARKFAHRGLNATTAKGYHALQERDAARTLQRLVERPTDFVEHFKE